MSPDLPPLPIIPLGRYRHYKGGEYEVVGVARHSESLEAFVMYRPLYNASGMWIRPLTMFLEQAEFNGEWQPRFRYLAPSLPKPPVTARPDETEKGLTAA